MAPNIYLYSSLHEYLGDWFRHKKELNKKFSLRLLATKLGYQTPMAAKFILEGKRRLPGEKYTKLKRLLQLSSRQVAYMDLLYSLTKLKSPGDQSEVIKKISALQRRHQKQRVLNPKQMSLFDHWSIPIVHEMKTLKGFKNDSSWVEKTSLFKLDKESAQASIDVLRNLSLWVKEDVSLVDPVQFLTEDEVKSATFKNYYKQVLSHFSVALDLVPADQRHLRTISIAVPADKIDTAKMRLNEFMKELQNELAGPGPDDVVVQILSGFIPTTKVSK